MRGVEQFPDRAGRLVDALLVLDEREAHVTVAAVAEPDPGTDRNARLTGEAQRDLQRAETAELLGDRCPDEHRPVRGLDGPAGTGEAAAERVAPAPVDLAHLGRIFGRLAQRDGMPASSSRLRVA